ncbi:unnamed protein product [Didymodactylos carnosus]|uniref:Tetratricopeptide repeat protein n=1 Tax=Didymodactylos carnosus TaxID=1234261 RepID=A0A8S2HMT0_9BILA|nr:unnamed protein product [Didymodactylos carnosus]CAF3663798.1 unnamed protein product [Didymodactylos carnosus]
MQIPYFAFIDNRSSANSNGLYQQSLKQHEKALEIRLKYLPEQHPYIAYTYEWIGRLYQDKNDHELALDYFSKAANILKKVLPSNHRNSIKLQKLIENVKAKISNLS